MASLKLEPFLDALHGIALGRRTAPTSELRVPAAFVNGPTPEQTVEGEDRLTKLGLTPSA
jgi:hypothetical protein